MEYREMPASFIRCFSVLMKLNRPRRYGGFTKGEMCILNYLADQTDPVLPGALAAMMEVSTARIAALLRQLEEKDWIRRSVDAADRRCVLVSITDAGRSVVLARKCELGEYFAQILDRLGEEDAREGLRILGRIMSIAEELEKIPYQEIPAKGNPEHESKQAV